MRSILVAVLLMSASVHSREYEAHYQNLWCPGEIEVTLADGSRVDCLTSSEAIEVDFSSKWAESIGQALLYARLTGKSPAVLLIVNSSSAGHIARFHNAADGLGIKLYTIRE